MRLSRSLERPSVEHRRTVSPAESERLAPFGPPAGVSTSSRASVRPLLTDGVAWQPGCHLNRRSRRCHPRKQASPPMSLRVDAVPRTGLPRHRVGIGPNSRRPMRVNTPRQPTRPDPEWAVRHELANHATLPLPRSTTPPTTLASDGHHTPVSLRGNKVFKKSSEHVLRFHVIA